MGARLTSMVGCNSSTGPDVLTVKGILNDSTTSELFPAELKLYVTSVEPLERGSSTAVPSTVVSVAAESADVTAAGNNIFRPLGKSLTWTRSRLGVFCP